MRNPLSYLMPALALLVGLTTATAANRPTEFSSSTLHPRAGVKSPLSAGVTSLGTYHNGVALRCADCHMMHQSKQHRLEDDPASDPFGGFPQNLSGGPNLLKSPDPVALCLACHDGQSGIPDVVGNDVNALTERSAGFFAPVGERNPRGHSLDYGLITGDFELCMRCHFGGDFTTASVTCIDCHNPHGNGRVRNLQWASYPGGEPQFGLLQATSAGLQKYEAANVAYATDNTEAMREVSNMCIDCHHVFSGDSYIDPDGNGWHNRHPSYDSERGSTNSVAQGGGTRGTTDPAHWESGSGAGFGSTARARWVANGATSFAEAMDVDATTNGIFCLSCHQAHGNDHSFALRWDPTTTPVGIGCEQCHNRTGL